MGKRVRYILLAAVLAAALVVSVLALREPEQPAGQPPGSPVVFRWLDGSEVTAADEMLVRRAKAELGTLGYAEDKTSGLAVELTIDPAAQKLARQAVDAALPGQPADLRQALVAVDPSSGRILAYHGFHSAAPGVDYAARWQNPGTAFLPFVLTTLLAKGKGIGEVYDGTSPRTFDNTIHTNPAGSECQKSCTVGEAMRNSTQTVFADIAFNEVGTRAVAETAVNAGIPAKVGDQELPLAGTDGEAPALASAVGGGDTQVRPLDLAGAYATFAAGGIRHQPHLVARVLEAKTGNVVYDSAGTGPGRPAFDEKAPDRNANIARNVTETLLAPAPGKVSCGAGMVCAGKSGTYSCPPPAQVADVPVVQDHTKTCATWMAGYTPQISAVVWVGGDEQAPLKAADGTALTATGPAGRIWQKFMDSYLADKPAGQFPPLVRIGR